jgi:TonB-dependent receptor
VARHQLRLIAGVRTEYSYIVTETFDNSGLPTKPILNDLNPLPGVNVVYTPIESVNVRFAWSQAVSRPELRELSPVQYPSDRGLRALAGNPDLISADITSYDVRGEWFFGASEVLSFGVFYKHLKHPIEAIVINQGSSNVDSFVNADEADLVGFEFESRTNLGYLTDYLSACSFTTNVTYVDSEAKISDAGAGTATTSSKRQLQGQAPFIVNAALDYTNDDWGTFRVLYNTIGDRLTSVGQQPLPDIFEERRDQLDFVYLTDIEPFDVPMKAKFAVENILNAKYTYVQEDQIQRKWDTGVKLTFGLSYSY